MGEAKAKEEKEKEEKAPPQSEDNEVVIFQVEKQEFSIGRNLLDKHPNSFFGQWFGAKFRRTGPQVLPHVSAAVFAFIAEYFLTDTVDVKRAKEEGVFSELIDAADFFQLPELESLLQSSSKRSELSRDVIKYLLERTVNMGALDFSKVHLEGQHLGYLSFCEPDAVLSGRYRKVSFAQANLKGCDFSKSKLCGADFSGANLTDTVFSEADLSDAIMSGANLKGALFKKTTFIATNLRGCSFERKKIEGARFQCADFSNADFTKASFMGCDFIECDFAGCKSLTGVSFEACQFDNCFFRGVDFGKDGISVTSCKSLSCDYSSATFEGVESFLGCLTWTDCDFTSANLRHVSMSNRNFSRSLFVGADLSDADFSSSQCVHCDFTDAKVTKKTNLEDVSGDFSIWTRVDFGENREFGNAVWTDARLDYARMPGANIRNRWFGIFMHHLYAPRASISVCNPRGMWDVDLTDANLERWEVDDTSRKTFVDIVLGSVEGRNAAGGHAAGGLGVPVPHAQGQKSNRSSYEGSPKNSARVKEKPWTNVNLSGCLLEKWKFKKDSWVEKTDVDLTGARLVDCQILNGFFKNIKLDNAVLSKVSFTNCDFGSVDLSAAKFENGCAFVRCKFVKAKIDSALDGLRLDADSIKQMSGARLRGAKIAGWVKDLKLTGTTAGVLAGVNWADTDLKGADICKVDFKGADLSNANMELIMADDADFTQAVLKKAVLRNGTFVRARFVRADMTSVRATKGLFFSADFTEAILTKARMRAAMLRFAHMRHVLALGVCFDESDLQCVDFIQDGASGLEAEEKKGKKKKGEQKTVFKDCTFSKASLKGLDLRGCDCSGSTFVEANLTNAIVDQKWNFNKAVTLRIMYVKAAGGKR